MHISKAAREAEKLHRTGDLWRNDCIRVLSDKSVEKAVGPISGRLVELAEGAGILAVNTVLGTVNGRHSTDSSSGVYMVPLGPKHSSSTAITVEHKGVPRTCPVGEVIGERLRNRDTLALLYSSLATPDLSIIAFYTGLRTNNYERSAVMAHELYHAADFFTDPLGFYKKSLAEKEVPAYEAQFRTLDVCYGGLLSNLARKNVATFDLERPPTQVADIRSDAVNSALMIHMATLVYGYKSELGSAIPSGLEVFFNRFLGSLPAKAL